MLAGLRRVGIHSESAVREEASGQYQYSATVQGHRGKAIVRVGKYRSTSVPEGYEVAVEGGERGQYTVYVKMENEGIEDVQGDKIQSTRGVKFIENGKLYIRVDGQVFDMLGNKIE